MMDRKTAVDKFHAAWKQFESMQAEIKPSEPKLIRAMSAAEYHMSLTFRLIAETYYPEEVHNE